MVLDRCIQILTVAVPIAKAMPLVGQSLEGGLTAILEICKMAQGTKALRGDCEILAERATFFATCVISRIGRDDTSTSELQENVKQFNRVVEGVRDSLTKLLQERKKKGLLRRALEWKEDGQSIQKLSKTLEDGVAGFTLRAQVSLHQVIQELVVLLQTASTRLEQGQTALLEGQDKLLVGQDKLLVAQEHDVLLRLDPELSACYDGANRVLQGAHSSVRGLASTCLQGTREHLLEDILGWVNSSEQGLFLLSGLAGTGKTTVALTVAKQLDERGQLLASFFILRGIQRRSNVLSILVTIAYQFARFSVAVRQHICRVLYEVPDITSKSLERQCDAFIKEPLLLWAIPEDSCYVIVIDALDECDDEGDIDGGSLIHLLVQAIPSSVKVILTGRPVPAIQYTISRLAPQLIKLQDMDANVVQGDIRRYLGYHLAQIAERDTSPPWPSEADLTELVRRCGLLFVYAATLVRFISVRGFSPEERLGMILSSETASSGENPYKTLDRDIYTHVVNAAVFDGAGVNQTLLRRFQLIIGTIILARDPLPISALANFVQISPSGVKAFLPVLSSVLVIPEADSQGVQVFHLSFSDFVTNKIRCPDERFYICPSTHHTRMACRCLELMKGGLYQDICGIKDPSLLNTEVLNLQSRLDAHVPPELRYSCRHWTAHLELANKTDSHLVNELSSFIEDKLLYWVELMSLIHELPAALAQLSRVQSIYQGINALDEKRNLLLHDCDRLVREFYDPIKSAALHIYHSALGFAPNCSLVSTTKDMQLSAWIIPRRHRGWSALLRTIEGHKDYVQSVSFSPDGLHMASGSFDRTVRIWDMQAGENTKTLEGHTDFINFVTYSPNGLHIVSGSVDETMRTWDVQTGTNTKTLEGHSGSINSAGFSPNGLRIVSGSPDRTVRVWDAQTGENTLTLEGHTDGVLSVAFSPDGLHIVSSSWDNTVRIWDTQRGGNMQTLCGHTSFVSSVAFSPEGLRIVSGSFDRTVRVWDTRSGKNTQILKSHTNDVRSVAFSPDGVYIVSGSYDYTIRVWHAQTGENTKTLYGHTSYVNSVAFSPDGRHIASGSSDSTVRVWDAQTIQSTETLGGHTHTVRSVAFSPDGLRIASGSWDKMVHVWDTQTGEITKTLKGHSGHVHSVAFSPLGLHIVSGSEDCTMRVWDVQTGNNVKTVEGHTAAFFSVAFSSNGLHIISGSADCTVRVWDAQTGENTETLEGHTGSVNSVALSADDLHIVSGSFDNTVRVWDMQTGQNTATFKGNTHSVESVLSLLHMQSIISSDVRSLVAPSAMSIYTVDQAGWLLHAADMNGTPQRRCWLPPGRRPVDSTCIKWHNNVLVIGGRGGIVTIIHFTD